MKKCSKCKIEKDEIEFGKDSHKKSGLRSHCLICSRQSSNSWKARNPDKIKAYELEHMEQRKNYLKEYVVLNRDRLNKYNKQWMKENDVYYKERSRKYMKQKRSINPLFKLQTNIQNAIRNGIKNGYTEKCKIFSILGCSYNELIVHLRASVINNYGAFCPLIKYQIDHIIPLSRAKTEEELTKLNHYTNLQYLTPKDNSNKWYYNDRYME